MRAAAENGRHSNLSIARRAVRLTDRDGDIEAILDTFHHIRRNETNEKETDAWKRADIIGVLNITISEKRTGLPVTHCPGCGVAFEPVRPKQRVLPTHLLSAASTT